MCLRFRSLGGWSGLFRGVDLFLTKQIFMSFTHFSCRTVPGVIAGVIWWGASCASAATSFELGVGAFEAGRYDVAKARFGEVRNAAPGDVLNQLWLGLATRATGGLFDGADEWRKATGHPRYESMAELFRGYAYWQAGYHNDARSYFEETQFGVVDGKAVDYAPGKAALADLAAGKAAPVIGDWPRLAGLPTSAAADAGAPGRDVPAAPPLARVPPPAVLPVTPPAQPAPPPVVAPRPVPVVTGYAPWSPFRTHAVGERVLFRVADAEWRFGTIQEVGDRGIFLDKYLVRDERTGSKDYYYYTDVTIPERRDFWTGYFIGTWALGSGMSVSQRVEGGDTRDDYLYVGSTERLEVKANGTYVWTTIDGKRIGGRWQAQPNNPGIVILRGDRERDYVFYNITDAETVDVMKEHHARMATPGVQTTLARRRIP